MKRELNGHRLVPFPVDLWAEMEAAEWSPAERFVAAFLLSCPERFGVGREGMFPMTVETICLTQSKWSPERVEKALQGLEGRLHPETQEPWLIRRDGWFLVPSVIQYDQPNPGKVTTGAVKRLRVAPRHSMIWVEFLAAVRVWAAGLVRAIDADDRKRPLSKSLPKTLAKTHGDAKSPANADPKSLPDTLPRGSREKGAPGGDARDTTYPSDRGDEPDEEAGCV